MIQETLWPGPWVVKKGTGMQREIVAGAVVVAGPMCASAASDDGVVHADAMTMRRPIRRPHLRRVAARAALGTLAFSLGVLAMSPGQAQATTVSFTDPVCSAWTVPDGVTAVRITVEGAREGRRPRSRRSVQGHHDDHHDQARAQAPVLEPGRFSSQRQGVEPRPRDPSLRGGLLLLAERAEEQDVELGVEV
jgi:hypothetical protein